MSTLADLQHLPSLDEPYPVTAAQREQYLEEGHIILRGIATPEEIAPYEEHISELVAKIKGQSAKPLSERDTYHKAFLQVGNLWEIDEVVKKFVTSPRFGKVASDLMGVDGVRLYHDQALYKEPGGGHTPWHQDQVYWPFSTPSTITMWMPLVDAPVESGTMVLASGSHKDGLLSQMSISDESSEFFRLQAIERNWRLIINDMKAGDATFHSGWTVHKAVGNSTPRMRKTMTVIWYEDGVKIGEPSNNMQPIDMARWFPGQKPGDVAGTHLNPVCWSYKK